MRILESLGLRSGLVAVVVCAAVALPARAQAPEPYRLNVDDVVDVQIVELNAEEAVARTWAALSRDYAVDTDGNISVALLGFVPAEGRTLAEFADDLARTLKERIGLLQAPGLSVSVVRYGPVYVLGDVAQPGAYALTPGAPAVRALSLAGGLRRATDAGYTLTRDKIGSTATLAAARDERARLIAREARLVAISEGAEEMPAMGSLGHPDGPDAEAAILADERRAFDLSLDQFREQLAGFERLEALLTTEIAAIERKIATQRERIANVDDAAARLDRLADRGLARSDQLLAIQATQASLENGLIDLEQALFETRARIAEAERDRRQVRADRQRQAVADLAELRQRLPVLVAQIEEARARQTLAERELGGLDQIGDAQVSYSLLRRNAEGALVEVEAQADTAVQPSDVLTVTVVSD